MGKVDAKWIRNKSDEAAIDQGCYFDIAAADRVRYFFERFLCHSKGSNFAGQPFTLLDWQWDHVIGPLYGWKMPDGTRRFRRCGVAIPKKNGKSTLLSGLGLYGLVADNEPGAEIYCAAADKDQASIIYKESANMVDASKALTKVLRPFRHLKEIHYPRGKGILKALSAEVETKEGLNIHYLLFDELHAQKTWDLWNTLRYGGAARRQPILLWITTAGVDKESLCAEQWRMAKDIQEGKTIDVSFLPYIVETPPDAPWDQESTWKAANPSYGVTLNRRDFEEACSEAKVSPINENTFRRYRLNQWTGQVARWIPEEKWKACATKYNEDSMKHMKCILGLDLSSTTDLTAAVLLFRHGLKYRCLPYFWVPEEAFRRREVENKTRIDQWALRGLIKVIPGDVIDYKVLRNDINELADLFNIRMVALDPWNATSLATDLQSDNLLVEYVRTGFASISAASKEFEKLVRSGMLQHPDHAVMNWMMSNVAAEMDASGNIKPNKARSADKIDGVVALILALAKMIQTPLQKRSKYERQGAQWLEN